MLEEFHQDLEGSQKRAERCLHVANAGGLESRFMSIISKTA